MLENRKELEERCYDICPEQPMLLLERCSAIVKDGMKGTTDRRVLKRALAELKLHPLFREKLLESLLGYDSRCRSEEEGAAGVLDYWESAETGKTVQGKPREADSPC